MIDVRSEFSLPDDRVWLNAAHQGPLPNRAVHAVEKMVRWKQQPHHLQSPDPFTEVPGGLRQSLAELLGANPDGIVLANSSSYGVHLAANGLQLRPGDEVIVAANDFPSTILPWLRLRDAGVHVIRVAPRNQVVGPDEVVARISSKTRAVCLTWVHSFSGHVIDIDAIGEVCRRAGAAFVVNGAQGVGGLPLSIEHHPIDVLTGVGFKWLCGPYGTGFCWLHPDMLDRIVPSKLYWLGVLTADDLARPEIDLDSVVAPPGAARHDVFGTANFLNVAALDAAVRVVSGIGVETIQQHNLALADRFVGGLSPDLYTVDDRGDAVRRSSILTFEPRFDSIARIGDRLASQGIDVARRRGRIRVSPHFYNSVSDIDRALEVLHDIGSLPG